MRKESSRSTISEDASYLEIHAVQINQIEGLKAEIGLRDAVDCMLEFLKVRPAITIEDYESPSISALSARIDRAAAERFGDLLEQSFSFRLQNRTSPEPA